MLTSFSIYKNEELSVLQLIEELAKELHLNNTEVNRITIELEKVLQDVLPENVEAVLNDWYSSGKLADFINIDLLGDIQNQVNDISVKPEKFNNDIQLAIDHCYSKGGGSVLLSGVYDVPTTLHLKENVKLIGSKGSAINYLPTLGDVILFYKNSYAEGFDINTVRYFTGNLLVIDTKYVTSLTHVNVKKVRGFGIYSDTTTNSGAIKLIASDENNLGLGFWGSLISDCYFKGYNKIIKIETVNRGWVNGCNFYNITAFEFNNFVEVIKSELSSGIDNNYFKEIIGQMNAYSKEMIIDTVSSNIYDNCNWFDIATNLQASFGVAPNFINYKSFRIAQNSSITMELYASRNYLKVGCFKRLSSISDFATFQIKGRGAKIDSEITVHGENSTIKIKRKNYGEIQLGPDVLKFYTVLNGQGWIDLYMRPIGIEYDVNMKLISQTNFTPNGIQYFDSVVGTIEISDNENINFLKATACKIEMTADQILGNVVETEILLTTKISDSDLFHSGNGFLIPSTGLYFITGRAYFSANVTGYRQLSFKINAVKKLMEMKDATLGGLSTIVQGNGIYQLNKGDTVTMLCKHNSGVDLTISKSNTEFSITKIGL